MAAAAGGARSRIRSRHEGPGISSRILASRGSGLGRSRYLDIVMVLATSTQLRSHPLTLHCRNIKWRDLPYITQTTHLEDHYKHFLVSAYSCFLSHVSDPRKPVPVCLTSTVLNIELREILRIYYWHNGSLILCGDVAIVAGSWQRRWRDSRMTGVIASGSGLCQDTSPGQYRSHHRQQVRYLKQYHQPVPNRRTRRQSLIISSSLIVFITRSCINIL